MALKPHSFIAEIGNNPFDQKNKLEIMLDRIMVMALVISLSTMGYAFYNSINTLYKNETSQSINR